MQVPTMNTPVAKCLELATHAIQMLKKFTTNAVLTELAAQLVTPQANLQTAQHTYEAAVSEILPVRVDIKYFNFVADKRIRLTQQKVEIADGKRGGRIASVVFPDGSRDIIRLLGESQIQAMQDLEGRLEAAATLWPEALLEKADIANHRMDYKAALDHRATVAQNARNKRVLRNAVKEAFITKYTEIVSRVEAEFPRDKAMQELFFDDVRAKSALAQADEDENNDAVSPES